MAVQTIPIKDGVIDVVFSPDDGGYYLDKTNFSTKERAVSKRNFSSAEDAVRALKLGRVRWDRYFG